MGVTRSDDSSSNVSMRIHEEVKYDVAPTPQAEESKSGSTTVVATQNASLHPQPENVTMFGRVDVSPLRRGLIFFG